MTAPPSVPPATGPWWEPLAEHDGDGNEDIKSKNNSSARAFLKLCTFLCRSLQNNRDLKQSGRQHQGRVRLKK